MKSTSIISLILILLMNTAVAYGQDAFRLIDPNDPGDRYGKAAEAGPPFLYFGSSNFEYYIDHANYNGMEVEVEAAFDSWNNAGPVQFTESVSNGVQLTAQARNPPGIRWKYI